MLKAHRNPEYQQYAIRLVASVVMLTISDIHMQSNAAGPNATDSQTLQKMMMWLSPLDHISFHEQRQEHLLPGTCQWFFESEKFQSWITRARSRLWCLGSGKLLSYSVHQSSADNICIDSSWRRKNLPCVCNLLCCFEVTNDST